MSTATLPSRKEVNLEDCWDLKSLYPDEQAWETDYKKLEARLPHFETFRGRLGDSADVLAEALRFDSEFDRTAERLGTYAFLKTTEDQTDSAYQAMKARFQNLAVRASQAASYMRPEILAIAPGTMTELMQDAGVKPFRLQLERLLRYRSHTLADNEERLLAMQGEMASAASNAFRQLNDADLRFGELEDHTERPSNCRTQRLASS